MHLMPTGYEDFKKVLHRKSKGEEEDWLSGQLVDDVYNTLFCKYVKDVSRRTFIYLMGCDYKQSLDGAAANARFIKRTDLMKRLEEMRNAKCK